MIKRILYSFLSLSIILPMTVFVSPTLAEENTESNVVCSQEYKPVCGIDNKTYQNKCVAEEQNGVDVSYDGKCITLNSETGLREETRAINFAGKLIEIGSTDIPTTIIVRQNKGGEDYTINISKNTILGQRRWQTTKLSDWIPGDQIKVIGKKNENTNTIDASVLINASIKIVSNKGANGWITKIDKAKNEIVYQWMNKEHKFKYDSKSRIVAGLKNPASVDDLRIGDRIRSRLLVRRGKAPVAKIIVVLRRGKDLFMKIRTFTPRGTIVRLNSTIIPTTLQVRIDKTPGLRPNDVNNLIGTEGKLVTVNITENTRLVRKYFGRVGLDEFSVGDKVMIVGRVNDDGTVDAKLVKDNSIWQTSMRGYAGIVKSVDVQNKHLIVNWTPIKYLPLVKLRKKLFELSKKKNDIHAQLVNSNKLVNRYKQKAENKIENRIKVKNLRKEIKNRIKKIAAKKIGKFIRRIRYKKIRIKRIMHNGIKIKDLITRKKSKELRVDIGDKTKIIIGTSINASISDIKVGDKVRIRGTRNSKLPIIIADKVVVVSSLPEIKEPADTAIDYINEIGSEITTDNNKNVIAKIDGTNTEKIIDDNDENSNNNE